MTDGISHTLSDQMFHFTLPVRDVRGRAVRLDGVLDTILSAHDYPPIIRKLLAEALVVTALIGSLLKEEDSQLTMQAQTDNGVVKLMVCDYRNGELRGYVQHDADRLATLGANPSLEALFGKGFLAVTFDLAVTGERYQGIVPLEGHSIAHVCEDYFARSEQVPTLIRVAVSEPGHGNVAGGLLIQHLPDGEEGRERLHVRMDHPHWEHASILAATISPAEMLDSALSMEDIVWRLFHEEDEVRAEPGSVITRGCRCSVIHFENVLSRFPPEERKEMRDENGVILVDCAFCSRVFPIQD
ncbi:MAG: Hsp33 family molecular chaperone HslO [Novosphingobium sp.]|nr:Hsp33 family molecular chaperone HslO [Novosphingobium sp.]